MTGFDGLRAAAVAGMVAACASAALAQAPAQGAEGPAPLTERHDTVKGAIASPAEDLNIKKTPIPEVLERAVLNPYNLDWADRCEAIAAEVQRVDAAIGPDVDAPPAEDAGKIDVNATAAGVVKAGVETAMPFRGLVRRVTGAAAYDAKLQQAIDAGFARRGFLKGKAMEMNCAAPASPSWFRPSILAVPQPLPEPTPEPAAVAQAAPGREASTRTEPPAPAGAISQSPLPPLDAVAPAPAPATAAN